MAAMPSAGNGPVPDFGTVLLGLARQSIAHGISAGNPLPVAVGSFGTELQQHGACFVTLHKQGKLRGCIGNLSARQPLAKEVADNAFAAAFRDPRFPVVGQDELSLLDIEISVLTPAEALLFDSEADLLDRIEPGLDGLILEDGGRRGTFLPSVWKQVPDRRDFLRHLKVKAGFSPNYWSSTLSISRYRTVSYSE